MELELELGHDPEVATASAKGPQELGVTVWTRLDDVAGGRHHGRPIRLSQVRPAVPIR